KHRPTSPRKESRPPSPRKTSPRPQSPKKEPKQTRSVETETSPQSNVEASLKSDVYKLEQLVLLLRREASQAKKEAQDQSDVVQGLRRDLAGASARMSDLAGELSDKQKQKLEEYEERIQLQDKAVELLVSRVKLLQERLDRKENLLGGYEKDLVNLRESQTVAGMKSAEASGLKLDVRTCQEEIAYLRESLSRLRDELDQERRVNVCLRERKKFAMDFEDRDTHRKAHSCYTDEHSIYQPLTYGSFVRYD
ncbi:predicted protein, partial [Nematostella vectensis]